MQYLAARNEHLELWAGREEIRHLRCCPNHLLEVVQKQQHLLRLQHLCKARQKRLSRSIPNAKRLGNSRHDQQRIVDRGERDKKYYPGEYLTKLYSDL